MLNTSLTNIYRFIQYMGLLTNIPNIKLVNKRLKYFNVITNIIYEILDNDNHDTIKINKLYKLNLFNTSQIEYIIANQTKIIKPYQYIINKRNQKTKKLNLQTGGKKSSAIIDGLTLGVITEKQKDKLIKNLQQYGITAQLETPIQKDFFPTPTLLQKINQYDFTNIINKFKSYGIDLHQDIFRKMVLKLGIPINKEQVLEKIIPYDKIGIIQFIENIKNIDFIKFEYPPISLKDWTYFPLWSIENLPVIGPLSGIPIDFLSVIIAQLDIFIKVWTKTLGNLRDPTIQTAISFFAVGTAGAGLIGAPVIVPFVNAMFDLLIHITSNLGTILNMFVHISRKNFGLAYILFCQIVPIFEQFMDSVINYMVILNNFFNRSNNMMKTIDVLLTNTSKVIIMLNPEEYMKIKDKLLNNNLPIKLPTSITNLQNFTNNINQLQSSVKDKLKTAVENVEVLQSSAKDKLKTSLENVEVLQSSAKDKLKTSLENVEVLQSSAKDKLKTAVENVEVLQSNAKDKLKTAVGNVEALQSNVKDKLKTSLDNVEALQSSAKDKLKTAVGNVEVLQSSAKDKLKTAVENVEELQSSAKHKLKTAVGNVEALQSNAKDKLKTSLENVEVLQSKEKLKTSVENVEALSSKEKLKTSVDNVEHFK